MAQRHIAIAGYGLLLAAVACGESSFAGPGKPGGASGAGTGGSASGAGGSGIAGAAGGVIAGAGGSSGAGAGGGGRGGAAGAREFIPTPGTCVLAGVGMLGLIVDMTSRTPIQAPVTAAVTVTRVASCRSESCSCPECGRITTSPTAAATMVVLAADGTEQWVIYYGIEGVPTDLFKNGDAFDLSVTAAVDAATPASLNQTIVLSRAGKLAFFTSTLKQYGWPLLPDLSAYGIEITDYGPICLLPGDCVEVQHAARVTTASTARNLLVHSHANVGDLSVSVELFHELGEAGTCSRDAKSMTKMGGFATP